MWLFVMFLFKKKTAYEMRISDWSSDVCSSDLFFRARRGAAKGFRFADPLDDRSCALGQMPSMSDQPLGVGDGVRSAFQLCIYYGSGSEAQQRLITRPVAGSIMLGVDGMAVSGWSHLGQGGVA